MSTKQCRKCKQVLSIKDFTKTKHQCKKCRSEYALKYYYKQKEIDPTFAEKHRTRKREDYWKNKTNINDRRYKKRLEYDYGITFDDWIILYDSQDGKCNICSRHIEWRAKDYKSRACVDHCHDSGHVRGLLCPMCNQALGLLQHEISYLEKAVEHLT